MKSYYRWFLAVLVIPLCIANAEEPPDIAGDFQRIVADYQRIIANTIDAEARASAGRLTRDAYRYLIGKAGGAEKLSADDLHALGQCHEAIDEAENAKAFYIRSLGASPAARTHLALARVNLKDDLRAAADHFAKAVELEPAHPDLSRFRLSLAATHQRDRDWNGAIPYLKSLLGYTKTLADRTPSDRTLQAQHQAVAQQLARVRRFASMTGNVAPALKVEHWAQGEATELVNLKGKVVLVDFCAMWAKPSRNRMELLKQLQGKYGDKGLEIVGLTLAYKHKYDADTDKVAVKDELSAEDECAGLAAFAKKHDVSWRLGIIGQNIVDEYGVTTLPHTVALDKEGNVAAILFGGDKASEDLDSVVKRLVE